jgi:hypothetical protein
MARTTLASDDSSGNPLSLRELERQVLATRAEADRAGNNSAELDQLGHRKFELNRQTMARPISCDDDAVVKLRAVRRIPIEHEMTEGEGAYEQLIVEGVRQVLEWLERDRVILSGRSPPKRSGRAARR